MGLKDNMLKMHDVYSPISDKGPFGMKVYYIKKQQSAYNVDCTITILDDSSEIYETIRGCNKEMLRIHRCDDYNDFR